MLADTSRSSAWDTSKKALALAIAAVMLTTTLVVAPIPSWVPVFGDDTESAIAHPGGWRTRPGYWSLIPNGTKLVSKCVQHDVDPATDTWVCIRTQSTWENKYIRKWVPPRTYWYHQWHPSCSGKVQGIWGGANTIGSTIPVVRWFVLGSGGYQALTNMTYC